MSATVFNLGLNGRLSPMSAGSALVGMIARARSTAPVRMDSAGMPHSDLQGQFLTQTVAGFKAHLRSVDPNRADAFSAGLGGVGAQDLTQTLRRVLTEPLAQPTGLTLFSRNTEVQPGAIQYKSRRTYAAGEAALVRSGSAGNIPKVELGQTEMVRPVRYLAIGIDTDLFQQMADNFMGINSTAQKIKAGRSIIDRTINRFLWSGNQDADLWGILDYPYLDKQVPGVAISSSSTAAQIIAAVTDIAYHAFNQSDAVFESNAIALSPRIMSYLAKTPRSTTTDTSILSWLKDNLTHIKKWTVAPELKDANGTGVDGILAYRDDSEGVEWMSVMAPTLLPPVREGLGEVSYLVAGFGGVQMPNVGNNVLSFHSIS
jgi:hypothetical protein